MGLLHLDAVFRPKMEFGGSQAERTGAAMFWVSQNQSQWASRPSVGTQVHSHGSLMLTSPCHTPGWMG